MEATEYLRAQFEELRTAMRELRDELQRTRHGLKGSVETMAIVQAEHVVEIRNLASHNGKLEALLHEHAKEHEARLRVMEDIAASMRDIPQRLGVLEHEVANHRLDVAKIPEVCSVVEGHTTTISKLRDDVNASGRFTWKDIWAAAGGIAAAAGVLTIIVNNS